ncbi:hypothetical protein BH09CHL1_BH09CHL1_25690 [soil metagenome]
MDEMPPSGALAPPSPVATGEGRHISPSPTAVGEGWPEAGVRDLVGEGAGEELAKTRAELRNVGADFALLS